MWSRNSRTRWRLVLLAAVRLASIYAIAAGLLLLPLWLWQDGQPQALQDLTVYAAPVGVVFGVAFVLLAVARRAGFVALWLVLGALWAWILRQLAPGYPSQMVGAFVVWSALAIPLALLGGVGVPAVLRVRLGRWKPSAVAVTVVVWAALLIPALALWVLPEFGLHPLQHAAIDRLVGDVAWFVWAPGAPLVLVLSLAHVWVGTAPAKVESAAA